MYRHAVLSIIALSSLMTHDAAMAAESDYTDEQQQLIAVDKRMQRAFVDKDIAALDGILTDDYILVLSDGSERTKSEVLKDAKSPDSRWEVNDTSGCEVKIHGPVAIVVASLHQKGIDSSTAFDSNVRISDTYILEDGMWRNVHAHASRAVSVKSSVRSNASARARRPSFRAQS
jgi:Domain of unknown function (DUF4440)